MMYKKALTIFIVSISFLLLFSLNTFAYEGDFSEIYDSANEATQNLLEDIGIYDVDFEGLLNLSPKSVLDVILGVFKGSYKAPFECAGVIIVIIVIFSVLDSFSQDGVKKTQYYAFFENALILITVLVPLSELITSAVSVIKTVCSFTLAFIPVYTGVISASGQPLSSFLYSSGLLGFAEICSVTLADCIIPVVSIVTSISIFSVLNKNVGLESLINTVKRVITVVISIASSLFVGYVNIKTQLAYSADSLSIKGIKMLSGSVIPVIGSSIGEALNSVIGAMLLVKSSLGVFAVIVILLVCLPTLTQALVWYISLNVCSAVSDALSLSDASKALKVMSQLISMLCIAVLLIMLIFILTTGNMISLRG